MKSFYIIYEEFCKSLLKEGGNAFTDVSRIKREKINKVVSDFKKNILSDFIKEDNDETVFLLGSTGKKKDSGDIDIGVDINALKENCLISLVKLDEKCAENGINSYINPITFNILHVRYPQSRKEFVQIDLILTNHPDFTKFFMFSPTENESRYKGAHRNGLLKAILRAMTSSNKQYDKNGKLIKWEQYDIDFNGLYKAKKTLVDENENVLTYKNTNEPLEIEYAKNLNKIPISSDVNEIINFIVGDFKETDIDTFEKLFDIVIHNENFKYRSEKNINDIIETYKNIISASRGRLEMPFELN